MSHSAPIRKLIFLFLFFSLFLSWNFIFFYVFSSFFSSHTRCVTEFRSRDYSLQHNSPQVKSVGEFFFSERNNLSKNNIFTECVKKIFISREIIPCIPCVPRMYRFAGPYSGPWLQRDLVLDILVGDAGRPSSFNFLLTFNTILPLLGVILECVARVGGVVGGMVDGNVGKSSSSRPGGFGCSGVMFFLNGSILYFVPTSFADSVGSETCDGGGTDVSIKTGDWSKEEGVDEDDDDGGSGGNGGGNGGVVDATAVAAATAANSSSAFRIRSKSLRVLNVLLLSFESSNWLILDEDGE